MGMRRKPWRIFGPRGRWWPLVLVAVLLAGCGANLPDTEQQPEPTPPEVEEPPASQYTAPLTGMPSDEPVDERVVAVMIENSSKARPQSGLDKADWVVEVLAEGWITRFVAFYQSQEPQRLGPVRSVRPYYIDLAEGMDAVLVHAGGSPEALARLKRTGYEHLDEIYGAGKYFWRESFRKMPHNLYTDMSHLRTAIADRGWREKAADLPVFSFYGEGETPVGTTANEFEIRYQPSYRVAYTYDAAIGQYVRSVNGQPHVDLETDEPLRVTNVIVLEASHRIVDNAGRREVNLSGEGDGLLFQNGVMTPIRWQRKDGAFFQFYDPLGLPVRLVPGNTWVNVIPDKPGLAEAVTVSDSGENDSQ
ncbi:MAG: DUF3048 domain-containing protein [Bacillota bacterium]